MAEYDEWFSSTLVNLINSVISNDYQTILTAYNEVQRGIEYVNSNPGAIQDLLVRMAQGLIGPIIVQYKLEKKAPNKQENIELSELESVLKRKRQDQVVNKMTGSLTSLMDLEDENS